MDTVCNKKRVQDSISCPSQIDKGSASVFESNTLRSREDSTSTDRSKIYAGQTCHRTSFLLPSKGWLLQQALSGSQEVGRMETSNRSVPTKSACNHSSFQDGNFRLVRLSLRKHDWAISLDLTDAYFHIPIHRKSRRFLRFHFMGKTYQFRALPFSLVPAPYVFSRTVKAVVKHCRRMGMRLHSYLDDWLQPSRSQVMSLFHRDQLLSTVLSLGFVPNWDKSELVPSQRFSFLGARFCLEEGLIGPSLDRLTRLVTLI